MTSTGMYRPHSVTREDRADGTIILRSTYPLGSSVAKTGDWVDRWAIERPQAVFLAERSGPGWREVTYSETRDRVRALASGLLARGLHAQTPIMIISGNGVDHGLLSLAAQYVGIPVVPLAEQYALIPGAQAQLEHCARLTAPRLVFAEDAERFGPALALDVFNGVEKVASRNVMNGITHFDDLAATAGEDLDTAAAAVGADTVAKYLMTSGSTGHPKGVITTHGMLCTNQTQIADSLPFLRDRAPLIVDWLPWNHTFGGSYNFNLMLANGGALYIDGGKPVKALVAQTVENLRLKTGTIAFNVPVGYALLRDAMREDRALRHRYFEDLDMLFYAGASLPQDVWADLEAMAREVRGDPPLFNSSWGMTETGPGCLLVHEPTTGSGIIGVPMPGIEVKLVPDTDMRCDLRVKGPNNTPGYLNDPDSTAALFDDEGFLISGDAVKLVDPREPRLGLRFDGRVSEDFKLATGTWVRASNLRLDLLQKLSHLAQDVVVCGADKSSIGVLVVPSPEARALAEDGVAQDGAIDSPALAARIRDALKTDEEQGSSMRIACLLVLSEPPSMGDGEITAKGNLNFRRILTRRAALYERLYNDADPAVIRP